MYHTILLTVACTSVLRNILHVSIWNEINKKNIDFIKIRDSVYLIHYFVLRTWTKLNVSLMDDCVFYLFIYFGYVF